MKTSINRSDKQFSLFRAALGPRSLSVTALALVCLALSSFQAHAQSPSVLYTWSGTGDVRQWFKNFGANTVTFANTTAGELTVTETGTTGTGVAISDDFNRIRETPTGSGGGLDLTGLDYLEFDIGHNGSGNINVQFFVQATTGSTFAALGADVAVAPGVNTYQVPLTNLTAAQIVYIRTIGINVRDHIALGNVVWTVREVRAGGTPLTTRDLITHDAGTPEGGLQGALVNFDNAAVLGNNGGQNQTGLSWNPNGSLQWTDLGGQAGAAISWGNGTALNGNTFNNRITDLSNYGRMIIRISASPVASLAESGEVEAGGPPAEAVGFNVFFQKNNFQFQNAEGGASRTIPTDGQFHEYTFSLAGLTFMSVVDLTGINLFSHVQTYVINVDLIRFLVPITNALSITKACASPIVTNVGSSLTVTGLVCNVGNGDLTNVIVVDSQPGVPTAATNYLGLLHPGQCTNYSFTYTATSCDPNHDVASVSGEDLTGTPVGPVTASADCFLCCPNISIQKLVGCLQPGAVCSGSPASYGQTATGIKGNTGNPNQDNPAFCYIIVVRNTGHDPLTNIVIHDDHFGAIGTFPGPLAVGGTITISNLRTNHATTTTNTASVTAQCGGIHANGAQVSATTNAVAFVVPAGITCAKLVSVNGCPPVAVFNTTDCTSATNVVSWYAVVTNTGQATVCNVVIRELGTGPDLLPCGAVNVTLTNCLAPGQGTGLIPLCTNIYGAVNTNINNSIRVIGTVASISNACAINITGSNIVVESQCAASLTLRANQCPTAVAKVSPLTQLPGLSNNIVISANNSDACVTLDGTMSSDPDTNTLTYTWLTDGFTVNLTPDQEPGGGGTGSGSGTVALSGNTLTINVAFSGMTANATAAHIHGPAGLGTNAAILYPLNAITTLGVTAGTISGTVTLAEGTGGFTIAQQLQQLLGGLWYINIHSSFRPAGEIRGQILGATDSGAVVTRCLSIGTHNICLTVSDGQCADTDCITVDVISPCQAVGVLIDCVENSSLPRNRKRPLIATLKAACESFEDGKIKPGLNQLEAFQNKVHAQVEPSDPALAQKLIDTAQAIIDALSGP